MQDECGGAKIELMASKQEFGNSLDLVNIKQIRDSVVLMKDGGFRQIVMVGGVNFALKSETEQTIITQAYQTFLNGLDFALQVVIHSRKVNIDSYIDGLLARKDAEQSPLLQNQIQEYAEFIKGFVQKNAIMEKTFLLVIPFYPTAVLSAQKASKGLLPFLGGSKTAKKDPTKDAKDAEDAEANFQENMSQIGQRTGQVMAGLAGMGLEATILKDQELIELFYNFYNPQTIERQNINLPKE